MPIYEFYCGGCHTLLNFFSSRVDTETVPLCPRCREPLARKPATFATLSRQGAGEPEETPFAGLDEARLSGALEAVMTEAEAAGGDADPRRMAALLRRFGDAAGLEPGTRMEELLDRLEAGEDPDRLEEELGTELDGEAAPSDLFRRKRRGGRGGRPRRDPELYFL